MDLISRIFLNRSQRRLRSGWRILLWIILTLLISTAIAVAIQWVTGGLVVDPEGKLSWVDQAIAGVGSVIAITSGVFLARRLFDRRSITSLGLRVNWQAAKDLLAGILIAGVIMFLIFVIERLAGWLTVFNVGPVESGLGPMLAGLGIMFIAFIVVAWQEELFARGYLMQNLDDGFGFLGRRYSMAAAVLLSSLVFGLAHLGNPNATWTGALGTGLAGVFLAYAYLASGQLWLPIGIHIGWNFFEGPILGFRVSGMDSLYYLVGQTVQGPEWITGGGFGPEAGLILLPALALGVLLVWLYARLPAESRRGD